MVGYNLYSLLFYLLIRLKFDKNYKEGTKMTLPILFSWPMTFFAFILLTISDFLYLKHEIKRLTDTKKKKKDSNNYYPSIFTFSKYLCCRIYWSHCN